MNCICCRFLLVLSGLMLSSNFFLFAQPQNNKHGEIKVITIPKESFKQIATLPSHIKEASGLSISENKTFWTHNDDGVPAVFCIDYQGNVTNSLHLNTLNNGWEDLARDKAGNLYIGAIGNNKNDKRDLKILKIKNPELKLNNKVYDPEVIHFVYEDQHEFPPPPTHLNFDADALFAYKDNLFIVTKNRTSPFTGYAKIYKLPMTPGSYTAELVDSIFVGVGPMVDNWFTSADLSPDGKSLALLGHDCIWLIRNFESEKFSSGRIVKILLNSYSHKAGISFASPTEVYIVDEKEFGMIGGNLYMLDLTKIMAFER